VGCYSCGSIYLGWLVDAVSPTHYPPYLFLYLPNLLSLYGSRPQGFLMVFPMVPSPLPQTIPRRGRWPIAVPGPFKTCTHVRTLLGTSQSNGSRGPNCDMVIYRLGCFCNTHDFRVVRVSALTVAPRYFGIPATSLVYRRKSSAYGINRSGCFLIVGHNSTINGLFSTPV